ncbi:MAG: glycosyltransferase family 4 protein [Anaerolineae bacterium]|nr:glycosyltransferase family 4 protein [Anaerolineae bacterium]
MSKIAIDYTPAYEQGGGIGRYVRELVDALARIDSETDYRLFVAGAQSKSLPPLPGHNFIWRPTHLSPRWLTRLWHRARLPLPIETFTGSIDLYHATDFVLPPVRNHTRTLLTVHDLSFVRVPEAASPRLKAYLDQWVPVSAHRADHILADSTATREDLIELYNVPSEKITVLLSGVDQRFKPAAETEKQLVREKYKLDHWQFIFSIGTIQPRKNYARLIYALKQLRHAGLDLHLVIAGGKGWLEDPIYKAIRETDMDAFVHFIGFAEEKDLNGLYSAASCFAFPSLYEGFGLPILESMRCGTPVVTSNVSSLPEVAGDAALAVNPYDVEAIAAAINQCVSDSTIRTQLVERGYIQAENFTWERSARQLVRIYESLLN